MLFFQASFVLYLSVFVPDFEQSDCCQVSGCSSTFSTSRVGPQAVQEEEGHLLVTRKSIYSEENDS